MEYFLAAIIIIFLSIIFTFSSPKLSPIPYFPTQKKDLPKIIDLLLKNSSVVVDFGAGDGVVIFEAAKKANLKKLKTKFYAIEINPFLIFILHLRRFFHPNKKNIHIIWGDIFKINLKKIFNKKPTKKSSFIFYLYISYWLMDKLLLNLKNNFSSFKNISFLSYFYSIKSLKKKEKIIQGVNKIYLYQ